MKSKLKHIISWFAVGVMMLSNVFSPIVTAYNSGHASTSFVMPDHNVTLKARSQVNSYTIEFRPNGWTGSMSGLTLDYNETWVLPGNGFTRTWYTFDEWNTDSAWNWSGYASGASVRNLATSWTVNLYAIWSANKYKVAFNKNEGEDHINPVVWTMSTQTYIYNTTWTLPENGFIRTWYDFLWWSTTSWWDVDYPDGYTGVYNWRTTSGETVTLYAKWRARTWVEYKVNHYLMNTWWTDYTLYTWIVYSGTTYELVTGKTWNYEWFTLSWSAQTDHIRWDGNLEFDYYYNRNQYVVTLHKGRWVASVSGSGSYYYNVDVNVSAELKTWYTWLNWTWDKTTSHFKMPATGVDMTASATPIPYTITVDVWSGTMWWIGNEINYNVEDVASGFVLPDPSRTWYDFVWWSWTTVSGTTSTGYELPAWTHWSFALEAVWEAKDVTYTVHHYHKVIWQDEYEEKTELRQTLTGKADAPLTMEDLSLDIDWDCVTYTWWSLTMSTWWLTNARLTTTILPNGNRHIYLYYTRNTHTVTLQTGDDGIASVTPTMLTVECGATVNIGATPKTWYGFKEWTIEEGPAWWNPNTRAPAIPTP